MLFPEGKDRYYEIKGRAVYDQQGQPVRLSGIVQDITERLEATTTLRQIENQLSVSALHMGFQNFAKAGNGLGSTVTRRSLSTLRPEAGAP